jgi:hypothetical protein
MPPRPEFEANQPMRRVILFAVLSLLLLSMQQQGYVHPITHLPGPASHSTQTALTGSVVDSECLECALLAGGANAVQDDPEVAIPTASFATPVLVTLQSRAADAPAWFHSRAPPSLL